MAKEFTPGVITSLNSEIDLVVKATSYLGLNSYGQVMIGNKGFEYYNEKNIQDYIQIPWEEIDYVIASVMFGGKYIPRFAIRTKTSGTFSFSTREPKVVLRAINKYIPSDHMVRSQTFWQVLKGGLSHFIKKLFKKDSGGGKS